MFNWSSYRGKLVSSEMIRGLERMGDLISRLMERQRAMEDELLRLQEDATSTEVIPVEIVDTEVRDGVEVHAWREVTTDDATQDGGRSSDGFDENDDPDEFAFAATRPEEGKAFVLKHYVAGDSLHEERYTLIEGSSVILAEILSNTEIDGEENRWEYEWRQVFLDGSGGYSTADGMSSEDDGVAYNLCELKNDGSDVEGPGWDLFNAPGTFNIQPIAECVVQLRRVPTLDGVGAWVFFASNVLDGECPEPEEEP